jgi:hypothetical protein
MTTKCASLWQEIIARILSATNMSDTKNDFDGELNADFWRDYIEEKEATRQIADAAFVESFWKFRR